MRSVKLVLHFEARNKVSLLFLMKSDETFHTVFGRFARNALHALFDARWTLCQKYWRQTKLLRLHKTLNDFTRYIFSQTRIWFNSTLQCLYYYPLDSEQLNIYTTQTNSHPPWSGFELKTFGAHFPSSER